MGHRGAAIAAAVLALVAATAAVLALAASAADAGEFPNTAFASSMTTRSEYVDEAALLFVFPERAGIAGSRILALDLGGSEALGAVGSARGHGFFLLSQRSSPLALSSLLQAGWGVAWHGMRLGVAGRAARSQEESGRLFAYYNPVPGQPDEYDLGFDGYERTLWEGALGLGCGGERVELDVAVDVHAIDAQLTFLDLQYGSPFADTTLVALESVSDPVFGGAGRLRWRLGGAAEMVGAGGWSRFEEDFEGIQYFASDLSNVFLERDLESWFAGLSASFPAGRIDWLAMTGHWRHLEDDLRNNSSRQQRTTTNEDGVLSIALRQALWRDLWGQAGIAVAYHRFEENSLSVDSNSRLFESRRSNASFSEDFAWGVSYVWRNVDLRAAVRETLPISNLFFALDFTVHP